MPWEQKLPMDQKAQFVSEYLRETISFSGLCERYQISRKTGYKWIDRYECEGPVGLVDRSRRPLSSPEQTPEPLRQAIIQARRRHPTWGAKKLLKHLSRQDPEADWPCRWTVCDILRREGLVRQRKRRPKPGHPGKPTSLITAANQLWCVDFKGQFKTRDGRYCYPLTVTDRHSRYLIGCQALASTETAGAKATFRRLFQKYGLPAAIRSDNGAPFASTALARLSALSPLVDQARHSARIDRARQTATERTTRTNAPRLESRNRPPTSRQSGRTTTILHPVLSRV